MLLIRRLSATSSETVGSMAWHRMTIFIRFKHKTMWQIMKKVLMSTERSTNLAATRNVPTLFYLKQISWSPLQYKSMCTGSSIFYAMTKVVNICAWMRCFFVQMTMHSLPKDNANLYLDVLFTSDFGHQHGPYILCERCRRIDSIA